MKSERQGDRPPGHFLTWPVTSQKQVYAYWAPLVKRESHQGKKCKVCPLAGSFGSLCIKGSDARCPPCRGSAPRTSGSHSAPGDIIRWLVFFPHPLPRECKYLLRRTWAPFHQEVLGPSGLGKPKGNPAIWRGCPTLKDRNGHLQVRKKARKNDKQHYSWNGSLCACVFLPFL